MTHVTKRQIAEFRYSIIGTLFSSPPEKGKLAERIRELAKQSWLPPGQEYKESYSVRTLERWSSAAKTNPVDPISALLPKTRSDVGVRRALTDAHGKWLTQNYNDNPKWTWLLHYDNLVETELGPFPSYATVRRWMKSQSQFPLRHGEKKQKRRTPLSYEA